MRSIHHKNHKRMKRSHKKLGFLTALRLYAGMPVGV